MTALRLTNVYKSFGSFEAIKNISLTVNDGEFIVFVGPSGCGKSTLLRLIAGLDELSAGSIEINGKEVTGVSPAKRGIAMVFQSYALYPHLSVSKNMSLALKQEGQPKDEVTRRVNKAASMLSLEEYLDRHPSDLSGGQRQRVAIGRAIVREPSLFLFDEPLSNLDASLRMNTRLEIAWLHRSLSTSMIYVTHDQIEAMTLADKIVVLNQGRIEQVGDPMELYNNPKNKFVAGFIGSPPMNFMSTAIIGQKDDLILGIRPEAMTICDKNDADVEGKILHVERLGGDSNHVIEMKSGDRITLRQFGQSQSQVDDKIYIRLPDDKRHFFDQNGDRVTL